MADVERISKIFKLFSGEARARIIMMLKKRGMCVTELESQLGITQEATSQHLRLLKGAGVIKSQKRGFHVYYSIDKQNMEIIRKEADAFFEL